MAPETEESAEHVCKKSQVTKESFSEVVQVKVGHEKTFMVHKDTLCRSAPYFKAALEGGFKESKDRVLELPDDDPIAFSHFQLWLYTGNILQSHECAKDIGWRVLISLYLFGDVRGIPGLQNEAIDVFIDKHKAMSMVPESQLHFIYENTLDGSALRKLMVDLFAFKARPTDDYWFNEQQSPKYPHQFLIDLAKSLYEDRARLKTKTTEFNAVLVRSKYHVHDDGTKEHFINQLEDSDRRPPGKDAVSTDW